MCHPILTLLEQRYVRVALATDPPIEGIVHFATPDFLVVRTSDGGWRFLSATEPPFSG